MNGRSLAIAAFVASIAFAPAQLAYSQDSDAETKALDRGKLRVKNIPMPEWLKVQSLGEMKKTLLEVIVVALSLFWLRIVLIQTTEFQWTDLVLPASILAIAGSVRIMKLDHG